MTHAKIVIYVEASLGYVNSLSFFTDTILAISAGFIMDSYGRKYSAIPGMLLIGLAFFILMLPGETAVYFSGAIFGIGDQFEKFTIMFI